MAGEAALGAVFGELLKAVIDVAQKTVNFKSILRDLKVTLDEIKPKLDEIEKLNMILDGKKEETASLIEQLKKGTELIHRCSSVPFWERYFFSKKLIKFKESLSQFSLNVQLSQAVDGKKILVEVNGINGKMDHLISLQSSNGGNSNWFLGSCDVPGLPDFIVGLDGPLKELKMVLLEGEASVVLLSAAGGCGKTTLAKMLCHDDEINGIFIFLLIILHFQN